MAAEHLRHCFPQPQPAPAAPPGWCSGILGCSGYITCVWPSVSSQYTYRRLPNPGCSGKKNRQGELYLSHLACVAGLNKCWCVCLFGSFRLVWQLSVKLWFGLNIRDWDRLKRRVSVRFESACGVKVKQTNHRILLIRDFSTNSKAQPWIHLSGNREPLRKRSVQALDGSARIPRWIRSNCDVLVSASVYFGSLFHYKVH